MKQLSIFAVGVLFILITVFTLVKNSDQITTVEIIAVALLCFALTLFSIFFYWAIDSIIHGNNIQEKIKNF